MYWLAAFCLRVSMMELDGTFRQMWQDLSGVINALNAIT